MRANYKSKLRGASLQPCNINLLKPVHINMFSWHDFHVISLFNTEKKANALNENVKEYRSLVTENKEQYLLEMCETSQLVD